MSNITLNSSPYWEDFNPENNFAQILFRPGVSVQARELTQLQSILKDQIAAFGNSIYKHGSVVIPGNSFSELNVPYVKLDLQFNAVDIDVSSFEGKIISNGAIEAYVKKVVPATLTDSNTLYVSYITGSSTSNVFLPADIIQVKDNNAIRATVASSAPTGFGSLAYINRGVYFVNGVFVTVSEQSVVISKYTSSPSCHVLLKINESIVTSAEDASLLDPALGSYNFAAPGADRLKLALELVSLPIDTVITDNYIEIMRYREGVLEEHARYAQYSELEKSLARRTYDESGDYLVSGFGYAIRDHLKTLYNNGVYTDGDRNKFVVEVNAGKGYIGGLETESLYKKKLEIDKARTADHIKHKSVSVDLNYGKYIFISDLKGLPRFETRELMNIYTSSNPLETNAIQIGTVRVIGIDYHVGDYLNNAIYKLYIDDLVLFPNYKLTDAGGLRYAAGSNSKITVINKLVVPSSNGTFNVDEIVISSTGNRAKVKYYNDATSELYVHRHDYTNAIPVIGDLISTATTGLGTVKSIENIKVAGNASIFPLPSTSIKTLKNESNAYDIQYTAWKNFSINTLGDGNGSQTITDGIFITPEIGSTVVVNVDGESVNNDLLRVTAGGTEFNIEGAAAVTTYFIHTKIQKNNTQPKTKVLTTSQLYVATPTTTISLGKSDIYSLDQVLDVSSNDITDRFVLNNGQNDFYYGTGSITAIAPLPAGAITISFKYFEHVGTSDYFCVDSYTTLGPDYISLVPKYRSNTTSEIYDLAKCIDFRPNIERFNTATVTSPTVGSYTTTSMQYYIPRIDVAYLTKDGVVGISRGVPKEVPSKPMLPDNSIGLFALFIPPYTANISDVLSKSLNNFRYTMSDIKKLDERITNVEYFSTLNSVETSLLSYEVLDPSTGLNRFKNGYLVDNFDNAFAACDFFNQDNRCSFYDSQLSAAAEDHEAVLVLRSTSTNYKITGESYVSTGLNPSYDVQLTLPYTEVPFIIQKYSTRVTNLNPFMVFAWEGTMTINPSFDVWVETNNLPTIYNTVNQNVNVFVPMGNPPPAQVVVGPSSPAITTTTGNVVVGPT